MIIKLKAYSNELHVSVDGITSWGQEYHWDISQGDEIMLVKSDSSPIQGNFLTFQGDFMSPETFDDRVAELNNIRQICSDWKERIDLICQGVLDNHVCEANNIDFEIEELVNRGFSDEEIFNDSIYLQKENALVQEVVETLIYDFDLPRAEWDNKEQFHQLLQEPIRNLCKEIIDLTREYLDVNQCER